MGTEVGLVTSISTSLSIRGKIKFLYWKPKSLAILSYFLLSIMLLGLLG